MVQNEDDQKTKIRGLFMAHLKEDSAEEDIIPGVFERVLFIMKIDKVGIDVGDQIIR